MKTKAKSELLKIGVIGCGYMAQSAHLPCLSALPGVELAAIYDPRTDVAKQVASRWKASEAVDSVDALLSKCEAVLVLTPVQFHGSNIKAALAAGRHVFTEKPLAMSAKACLDLAELASSAKRSLQVGYMKQHEDNVRALQGFDRKGWGKLLFVRTHSFIGSGWNANVNRLLPVISGPAPEADLSQADPGPAWLKGPRDAKFHSFGNPYYGLLDTGCHSVNLIKHLTGKGLSVRSVSNSGKVRKVDFDMEGVPATMEFCVNFEMRLWDEVTELYYEKATVKAMTPPPLSVNSAAKVEIHTESGAVDNDLTLGDTKRWAFLNQLESFVESVKAGHVVNNGAEAAADVQAIEDVYRKEINA